MNNTAIEWSDKSWNPTTGCNKVSAGCKNCYAEKIAIDMQSEEKPKYRDGFEFRTHEYTLSEPSKLKTINSRIFVNSMSDLFHDDMPVEFLQKVFKVMNENRHHIFQVLTKRSNVLKEIDSRGLLKWTPNIWMGVSVEDEKVVHRIDDLRETKAHVKFLSCEPLIGPLYDLNLNGIDQVIVGGESGPVRRPIEEDWVVDLKSQCQDADVAFFFKQWGGLYAKSGGKLLQGKTYLQMPKDYYVREKKLKDYLESIKKAKVE